MYLVKLFQSLLSLDLIDFDIVKGLHEDALKTAP